MTDVYPTGDELPENLLRFYIYFSKPMQTTSALDAIHLLDGDGRAITGAFLSNRFDLWSPDRMRLTLLLDPGRVKEGLQANVARGRAIRARRAYDLVIGPGLRAMDESSLASVHRKRFRARDADRTRPMPAKWTLGVLKAGSSEPLVAQLDGAYDHLSLAYRIRIRDNDERVLKGRVEVVGHETEWRFVPSEPWQAGRYRIVVAPELEDLAGNRMSGAFERPLNSDPRSEFASRYFDVAAR